jgi:hypothetical protein
MNNRLILAKKPPEEKQKKLELEEEKKKKRLARTLRSLSLSKDKRWQSRSARSIPLFLATLPRSICLLPSTLTHI